MVDDVQLRSIRSSDFIFIKDSWIKAYRQNSWIPQKVPYPIYQVGQADLVQEILHSDNLRAWVACSKEDDDHIIAYGIAEHQTPSTICLHWIYCKQVLRKFGVGKMIEKRLVQDYENVHFSHQSKFLELIKRDEYSFNPYLLYRRFSR